MAESGLTYGLFSAVAKEITVKLTEFLYALWQGKYKSAKWKGDAHMASATNEQMFAVAQVLVSGRIGLKKVDREKLQRLINNPDELARRATLWLENDCQVTTEIVIKPFKVWREAEFAPMVADQFIAELEQAECFVSDWAKSMMRKPEFQTLKKPIKRKLARVQVQELGFTEMPTTDELFARIAEVGGELLPPEAGPQLRKDCDDQPNGDVFWLAMKQITDSAGYPYVFWVRRDDDGRRVLDGNYANSDYRWYLVYEFVFALGE